MSRVTLKLVEPTYDDTHLECDLRLVGRNRLAERIFPVSHPGKIPCPAWGLPAHRCRMGNRLARTEGSVCHPSVCYAKTGRFKFDNVQRRLELAYQGLHNALWGPSAIFLICWEANDYFRWFHSGDLQSVKHLLDIITICRHTPHVTHWLPTRERATVLACRDEIPPNLRIRASATMVDGEPPTWWPMTSTVADVGPGPGVCPAPEQDHECRDCRDCVDPAVRNVTYRLRVRPIRPSS